jgi:hypothetical protein
MQKGVGDSSQTMEQSRCPTSDEWNKKIWHVYTMEFYSVIRKKEIISFVCKWMALEDIMLNEVSQIHKDKGCIVFSHMWKIDLKDSKRYTYMQNQT